MSNPIIIEMIAREQLQRLEAELQGHQTISRAEREAWVPFQRTHTRTGVIQLARRFFGLFGKKQPASAEISAVTE